ncbi:hypothetical protein Ddye_008369 [Dipteronia dyeriana]|uniref:FAR1 domain-containing protein n=1 Tax=Dipteronia dyeriana TaxID=168575 RepID=A0AAE0CL94_9ROSI|nr:hypothetical protein Ddye_008369 [Dipteronia dyeriana]
MKFDYVEDARSFYLGYTRGNGFAIRATNLDHDSECRVLKRKWVCDKHGSRREDPTLEYLDFTLPPVIRALMRLRNNFFTNKYPSNSKSPVILSHLKSLEKHASSIYTYRIYCDITKQINGLIKYLHVAQWNEDNEVQYVLTEYDSPYKKTMAFVYSSSPDDDYLKSFDIARLTSLNIECNYLCHKESQTEEGFNLIKKELNILRNTLQGLDDEFRIDCNKNCDDYAPKSQILKDPNVVKTKSRPTGLTAPTTPAVKP